MNRIFLVGNLARDPEAKNTPSGVPYARTAIAVWKPSRDDKNACDFFNLVAWDKQAEFLLKHCRKGTRLIVVGRVQTSKYKNKAGAEVAAFEVVGEEFTYAGN